MNILITSVGRRAYMVKYFKNELADGGEVHICNSDELTVAIKYADKSVISPLIYSDDYIPFLLDYCKKNSIDILLSLFDIDLLMLAKNKEKFREIGTRVIVSDSEFIEKCNDKWKTFLFLKENNFNVPESFISLQEVLRAIDSGDLSYPIMLKPRFGCGSIAVKVAEDEESLLFYYKKICNEIKKTYLKYESSSVSDIVIFQEFLHGQEYGADIINDLNGRHINSIIKKKLAMRSGETDIAETVDVKQIKDECDRLGNLTGHISNLDCDLFLVNNKPYILEMNARFGGGYPFSHTAGCNLPKAIVEWCKGNEVPVNVLSAKNGVMCFKEIYITQK